MVKVKKSERTPMVIGIALLADIAMLALVGPVKFLDWKFLTIFVAGGIIGESIGSRLHRWLTE